MCNINDDTVKIECPACKGTGVYRGYREPKGSAVICYQCEGKGYREAPVFKDLKPREDIIQVYVANSHQGLVGKPITYQEFLEGKRPDEK